MCNCVAFGGSRDTGDKTWQQPLGFTACYEAQPAATASTGLNLLRVELL